MRPFTRLTNGLSKKAELLCAGVMRTSASGQEVIGQTNGECDRSYLRYGYRSLAYALFFLGNLSPAFRQSELARDVVCVMSRHPEYRIFTL
jgi:hypothetical protein